VSRSTIAWRGCCGKSGAAAGLQVAAIAGRTGVAELDDGDGSSQAPQRAGIGALGTQAQMLRTAALAGVS
jgi:hypothetical protein